MQLLSTFTDDFGLIYQSLPAVEYASKLLHS